MTTTDHDTDRENIGYLTGRYRVHDRDFHDEFLRDFPHALGHSHLLNPRTGLYCVLGWALHCAGVTDSSLLLGLLMAPQLEGLPHNTTPAQLAALFCGYSLDFWTDLVDLNDGSRREGSRRRAARMRRAFDRLAHAYPRWEETS